ncbi:MAG: tRNA pseudouridine(38-40) synthase TruA [Candidatus Onthomonas sp.]
MRNIALQLMYVGTAYHGWQIQNNAATVQETLEQAVSKVVKHPVRFTGAGRTDAGVHARVYIANFRTTCNIPCERMPLAFNARLPEDIVVVSAREVSEGFNAIGSCRKKEYTYQVYNSRIRNAFYVDRAYFYPKRLDERVMARAAQEFVGTRDFAAVRDVGTNVRSTVRTVYYFDVAREGDLITLKVCANGFLYNMVRIMVGTVLYAAEGKLTPEDIREILLRGNRVEAGPTVPPGGLYMTKLWYREPVGLETDPEE